MFGIKLYMFRTVPVSIIRSFSLYTQQWCMSYKFAGSLRAGSGRNSVLILLASCQQTCMTYTIVVCTVKNSWWWTQELSETCRVLFQTLIWEISASSWFYYKNLSRCTVTWTSNLLLLHQDCELTFCFVTDEVLSSHLDNVWSSDSPSYWKRLVSMLSMMKKFKVPNLINTGFFMRGYEQTGREWSPQITRQHRVQYLWLPSGRRLCL